MFALLLFIATLQPSCGEASECRRQATEAIARGEYELAHDLAWRAVQKGKPNDPDSMLVLARTQALSGRPGDALVMLGRIADAGVAPAVAGDPDFDRVRELRGWPELEAKLAGKPAPPAAAAAVTAVTRPAATGSSDALAFSAPSLNLFALAHDAVSRRFVLGDRAAHRLLVVDEVSRNVATFVSAETAGFYDDLTGFALDARRGDLWVASARGDGDQRTSVVHKLQLVSGRALMEVRAPDRAGAVRLVALAVAPDGTVYALDAAGGRLFRVRPGARTLEQVMRLDLQDASALACAGDQTLYVGAAKGLIHIDVTSRVATVVKSADDLGGFASLSWHSGALLGVERRDGAFLVVRVKLDASGLRAEPRQVLATSPTPTVGALAGDSFYYVADATIRRVALRIPNP